MTIGFICGAFDLLHPGHLVALRDCKDNCDHLIVGLQVDPNLDRPNKHKPIESIFERYIRLNACKYVDQIIPYETDADLLNLLKTIRADVRFLDEGYTVNPKFIIGEKCIPIFYIKRDHTWSSTALRDKLRKK